MAYKIYDTFGAPQCGCEVIEFESWHEVEEYFEGEDACERLHEGYAYIEEV